MFLTSILRDKVYNMLLESSLQGFHKLITLVLRYQQIQHGFTPSVHRSLTANISYLGRCQDLKGQKLVQQPKIWFNDVCQARFQSHDTGENDARII